MTSTTDTVIDLATAKARVIDRMAKAEIEADRASIAARRADEEQGRERERIQGERRERETKLHTACEAARARLDQLDTEGGKLVAALVANFREREQLANADEADSAKLSELLGQAHQRQFSSTSAVEREQLRFAGTIKATLSKDNTTPGAFFQFLNHRAVLFAQ